MGQTLTPLPRCPDPDEIRPSKLPPTTLYPVEHTPLNLPPRTLSSVERTPSLSVVVTRALSIEHSVAVVSASTCACYCLATSGRYGTTKKKARAMCAFQQREGKSPDLYPFFDPIIVGLTPQKCWDDTSQHDVQSA